ncbi:hypothetical protein Tco_0787225 [Tanacetum coccineum]
MTENLNYTMNLNTSVKSKEKPFMFTIRFITEVKLNRGLKESNFDLLYAYLKKHENFLKRKEQCYGLRWQSCGQDIPGRYNANNQGRPFQRNNVRGNVVVGNAGGQKRGGNVNPGEHVTNFDDDVDDPNEKHLALNVDHIFKANQCDAFDSNVDEARNIQTMFMVNLSSEDPIYDEVGPSYDSNTSVFWYKSGYLCRS